MGMELSTIYSISLCINRKDGWILDASVTKINIAKNYDDTSIENMKVLTLAIQAKDDKLMKYLDIEKAVKCFSNCTYILFENGGHLLVGSEKEIEETIFKFMKKFN